MKKEPTENTGLVGELWRIRVHGKTYEADGTEVDEKHEADCVCCRSSLLGSLKSDV